MKKEQFFEAFSNIDSKYIEETKIRIPKKRSKKILWRVIAGLITLLLLVLAILPLIKKQNPYYAVRKMDGEYYLVSKIAQKEPSDPNQAPIVYIEFYSIQEMYDDFIQCDLKEHELTKLKAVLQTHKKIAIPNLDALSQPVFPDNFIWVGRVVWYGDSRYLFFLYDTHQSCIIPGTNMYNPYFWAISKQDFIKGMATELSPPDNDQIISFEQVEDRNATVYHTQSEDGEMITYLFYTIQDGDKEMYIKETVGGEHNTIHMYIRDGNLYGHFYMTYIKRPSVEWLSSFGLEPYEIDK